MDYSAVGKVFIRIENVNKVAYKYSYNSIF